MTTPPPGAIPMSVDANDPSPVLALLRATRHLVAACLDHGWSPEDARAFALERAGRGIPEGNHPALAFARAALARAVDGAIALDHPDTTEGD